MGMLDTDQTANSRVEDVLRKELARDDRSLSGVAPVLTHLLGPSGFSLVSEAIVARLRGMLDDIARQVLRSGGTHHPEEVVVDQLADDLASDTAILSHLYATAVEWQLTERLEARHSVDPVLSTLLQELIGSDDPRTAELAMSAMAAQSRFVQSQRRMQMPVNELPAEHFHRLTRRSAAFLDRHAQQGAVTVLQTLKRQYDESATRAALFGQLVSGMGSGARAALDVEHAGFALLATSISVLTRQPRELAVLGCHKRQGARLALGLRAAGLDESAIAQQFAIFEPVESLPRGISDLSAKDAQAILVNSSSRAMG